MRNYVILIAYLICSCTCLCQEEIYLWTESDLHNDSNNFPFENYVEQNYIHPTRGVKMAKWDTHPSLLVFRPDPSFNSGISIILNPGGGMNVIELEHEGITIAKAFTKLGINTFVLKYSHYSIDIAKKDALRAIEVVRARADEWNIDKNAIGMGGFSAGGRLSLLTTLDLLETSFNCDIPIAFLMLVYTQTQLQESETLSDFFPPTFQLVTADDFRYKMNLDFYKSLQDQHIPSELHIFQKGGHGFGIGDGLCNCAQWPNLFAHWLVNNFKNND